MRETISDIIGSMSGGDYTSDEIADAVLDAMGQWTAGMHEAGLKKFVEMHGRAPSTQFLNAYRAMIQAARDGK